MGIDPVDRWLFLRPVTGCSHHGAVQLASD